MYKITEVKFVQDIDFSKIVLKSLKQDPLKIQIIYFLFREEELVYIGQTSNNIQSTIERHIRDKKIFTHYGSIEIPKGLNLKAIEELCIDKYAPELNNDHKFQKKRRLLAKTLGISYEEALKLKIEIKS